MTHININAAGILYKTKSHLHFVDVSEIDVATSSKNCPRKRVKSVIKVKMVRKIYCCQKL